MANFNISRLNNLVVITEVGVYEASLFSSNFIPKGKSTENAPQVSKRDGSPLQGKVLLTFAIIHEQSEDKLHEDLDDYFDEGEAPYDVVNNHLLTKSILVYGDEEPTFMRGSNFKVSVESRVGDDGIEYWNIISFEEKIKRARKFFSSKAVSSDEPAQMPIEEEKPKAKPASKRRSKI